MGKKNDIEKIKNILVTMTVHPSFTVKVKESKNVANMKNCEYSFPLGTVNPVPTHISVKDRRNQGFDIFFDFSFVSGGYSFKLKIGDKECNLLTISDLSEIYKMSYNRIQTSKNKTESKIKETNEFISYLKTALIKRQNQNQ